MPTKTEEATVWVTNLATGHTHAMKAEQAAYYLNQRDALSGARLYEEGSAPKAEKSAQISEADLKRAELEDRRAARTVGAATKMAGAGRIDGTPPEFPHGVPDAARMEVATSAGEMGPTMRETTPDQKEVTGSDYASKEGPDRIAEAKEAVTEGQTAAHQASQKAAAKAATKAASKTDKE